MAWGLSPNYFDYSYASVRFVGNRVRDEESCVHCVKGSRPAISLASGNVITSGTGSEPDPWIVE